MKTKNILVKNTNKQHLEISERPNPEARETSQRVKGLLHKDEDLSSNPQKSHVKLVWLCLSLILELRM